MDPNYSITLKRRTDVTLERLVFEMTNVTTQLKLTLGSIVRAYNTPTDDDSHEILSALDRTTNTSH